MSKTKILGNHNHNYVSQISDYNRALHEIGTNNFPKGNSYFCAKDQVLKIIDTDEPLDTSL